MSRSQRNERRGGNVQKAATKSPELRGNLSSTGKSGDLGKSRSSKVWGVAKKV